MPVQVKIRQNMREHCTGEMTMDKNEMRRKKEHERALDERTDFKDKKVEKKGKKLFVLLVVAGQGIMNYKWAAGPITYK
jgi:hypothetical protein